jgi:hypothetical protein
MSQGQPTKPTKKDVEAQLEEALEATFPASDPIAVGQPTAGEPRRPAHRKPAKIDEELVSRLAQEVAKKH